MAEAVDEATYVVRQFLEDPKNDSVRPPLTSDEDTNEDR